MARCKSSDSDRCGANVDDRTEQHVRDPTKITQFKQYLRRLTLYRRLLLPRQ
jgi:hypothetical protein